MLKEKYIKEENWPNFTNQDLHNYLKFIKSVPNIKIVEGYVSGLFDFSLKSKGFQEDKFYMENDYFRKNLRRGNSYYELNNSSSIIVRKGLEKFFYLRPEHVNLCTKIENKCVDLTKKIIFDDIIKAFSNKRKVINKLVILISEKGSHI